MHFWQCRHSLRVESALMGVPQSAHLLVGVGASWFMGLLNAGRGWSAVTFERHSMGTEGCRAML